MTKHLEERLSEALDAAARTVPDNAAPPELFPGEEPSSERRWVPVLVGGLAMAAVIAAVVVPLAISREHSAPAGILCPAAPAVEALKLPQQQYSGSDYPDLDKLPFGPPPSVPFTMARDIDRHGGYLEDRGVRVPLPDGQELFSIGRIDCGWVAYRQSGRSGDAAEVGVLGTDGKYRSFGPVTGDGASLSRDGSELAYVAPTGKGTASVVTVSVASGKRLAATPATSNAEVVGWNSDGVWFMRDRDKSVTQVWEPDGGRKPVTVDTDGRLLTAYRGTDRMLLSDQAQAAGSTTTADLCVRVATLGPANKLITTLQVCGGAGATLSPDGQVLVADQGGDVQAYLVDGGSKTSFHATSMLVTADHEAVWEDSTHLLNSAGLGTDRQMTLRCDVVSGACERIQDGPQTGVPAGPELGYP
ncbi:hypothetical protein GCM10009554_83360 [Kribbella koreensis]|uniref:WD40 repeat protein n=1 Tax=Kribbella koreensis TaxID=57909 RepID=A0ABP4CB15_9ACTN